jgi:hypothetical protein
MLTFLEVMERVTTGPMMTAKEYDMKVFIPAVRKVVKKYDIKFDRDNPCPADDDLADRMYQAAVELYAECGSYCTDTQRNIRFSKEEIEEAVYECPKVVYFGEGPDRVEWRGRMPDDNTLPNCHVGSGTETTEDIALKMVEAYGRISKATTVSVPAVTNVGHMKSAAGSPIETLAGINMMRIGREGLRRAGRPGMPIIDHVSSCAAGVSTIAASNPEFGAVKSDGWIIAPHAEFKINYSSLNQVAYFTSWGANIGQEAGPIMGGYAGGPEGTAITTLAYAFHGILIIRATYHLTYPIQMLPVCSTTPEMIYVISTSSQAFARNIGAPYYALGYASAGPATREYFLESAAYLAAIQSSGIGVEDVHPNKAVGTNQALPIDSEFSCSFAHGNIGLTRKKANKIIKELQEKYMPMIKDAPKGRDMKECYDMETIKPDDELKQLYAEAIEELKGHGLDFK